MTDELKKTLNRAELVERLKKLAESEPPKDLKPGACCYVRGGGCGCFFISLPIWIISELLDYGLGIHREYRVPLNRLRKLGITAKLICHKRKFYLEIRYPDHLDPVMVKLKEPFDLELMALFLQEKDRYRKKDRYEDEPSDCEIALIDEVYRLTELFGIDIEEVFCGLATRELTEVERNKFFRAEYETLTTIEYQDFLNNQTFRRAELMERLKELPKTEPLKHVVVAFCYYPSTDRLGKKRMKMLQTILEEFGQKLAVNLSTMLQTAVDVKLACIDQLPFSEFTFGLDNPTYLNLLHVEPLKENWLLDIHPAVLYPIIDHLLDGDKEPANNAVFQLPPLFSDDLYPYTPRDPIMFGLFPLLSLLLVPLSIFQDKHRLDCRFAV